jgi:opacity protein-like surface antigen
MRLFTTLALLCLSLPTLAQRNDLAVYAVGNFNSASYIYIPGDQPVAASDKSSLGGGIEYRRWITPHIAVGPWFEANPSDGKLEWFEHYYIWPVMRYEFATLATEQFKPQWKIAPFFTEGPGFIVTQSLVKNSGWSEDFALFIGAGVDYRILKHWAARAGLTFVDSATGCYGDPTCTTKKSFAVSQDVRAGLAYRW